MRNQVRGFGLGLLALGLLSVGLVVSTAQAAAQPGKSDQAQQGKGNQNQGELRQRQGGRGGGGGQRDPKAQVERMKERILNATELNLTAEQKTKIGEIFTKAATEVQTKAQAWESLQGQERRTQVRQYMDTLTSQVREALNETQRPQFDRMLQDFRGGRGGFGGGRFLERSREAVNKLDLTDDQKKQVEALYKETQEKMDALRNQAGQNNAQPGQGGGRGRFREVFQAHREKLMEILTPEQEQRLEELLPQGGGGGGFQGGGRRQGQQGGGQGQAKQ